MIEVVQLSTKTELRRFIDLQFEIYKGDPCFVPPLIGDLLGSLMGKNNRLFEIGPHAFFIAYRDGKPVARVLTGCDNELNNRKGVRQGYVSLLDFYEDYDAFQAIMNKVIEYQKSIDIDTLIGPNSYTFNDFGMGCLIEDFDVPPMLYCVYNKPYYADFYERYGFKQHLDHYSFYFEPQGMAQKYKRYDLISKQAMERYNFHVVKVDLNNDMHLRAIHRVFCEALPATNEFDIPAPTLDDVYNEMREVKPFYDDDYTFLAFAGDRPIGFFFAIPDYNQVLKRMNGHLLPLGVFKFLYYRKKIDAVRVIISYVVEEYKNRAVPGAIFCEFYKSVLKNGIQAVEGSTIAQGNYPSLNGAERAGGRRYRTTRQYQLKINQ